MLSNVVKPCDTNREPVTRLQDILWRYVLLTILKLEWMILIYTIRKAHYAIGMWDNADRKFAYQTRSWDKRCDEEHENSSCPAYLHQYNGVQLVLACANL